MNNQRFNIQPPPDTDGITKIVEFTPADLKVPPRHRTVADIESLASYLQRWAKPDRTIVYCHGGEVVALLDEEANDDTVVLKMERTRQSELWLPLLANKKVSLNHKSFKSFLEDRYPEVEDGSSLFAMISNLSLATTFTYDAKLDNERSYSIKVESDDGASVVKLPTFINVQIPIWEGLQDPDAAPGTDKVYAFPAKLLFSAPSEERKEPWFGLYCETFKDVINQSERDIVVQVRAKLEGWQVVNGQPGKTR